MIDSTIGAASFMIACSHQKSYDFLSRKNDFETAISFASSPEYIPLNTSIIILDQAALNQFSLLNWKKACSTAIFIIEHPVDDDECILVPTGIPEVFLKSALIKALNHLNIKQQLELSHRDLQHDHEQMSRLLDVGQALSAERDHNVLLARILKESRLLACCDAASIFLIDRHAANESHPAPDLVFKLTQNDSIDFHFQEQRFGLDNRSVAGYSALTGEIINLDDVYDLPASSIYQFNASFDQSMNYRTCSMLVIPMRNHQGQVIGVIQFINRKRSISISLSTPDIALRETIGFDQKIIPILQALASQAAVAIENNVLIDRVNLLFDGFVKASVRAIEQRDPTTSGHSFRVAELTCALAETANKCDVGKFQNMHFNNDEMRELRFAALLHDFGKVGVREHILTKAKKLSPEAYGQFIYRIAWEKERISNYYLKQKFLLLKKQQLRSDVEEILTIEEMTKLQRLNDYMQAVAEANEPSLLSEGTFEHLKQIREYIVEDIHGNSRGLIDELEFGALSIKRGSLTTDERLEIESHVSHTIEFLKTIPWTPELSNIPKIAGAHHEKLNGCGYPNGLKNNEIPFGAKIMAVCDIFDALTAKDRPYKAAVPLERALTILQSEVECGHVEPELVTLFTQAKIYQILDIS
ncbi:MAG: GAF domain-containing protein [Oleispira antarctica]|nr:GAF domain-containing protein [Oleispira antarctica]MBQ0793944.1 GAF domain-containing protein [Oleispira antarctica]